ncbi:MAG: class IIb bacteriocin, lactobin A/cerein 7B family [Bacteroidales bacterium]|nr:class IIb bacteriocin, lactobin A/cerein 7B family [Bacteroidales bacterium]
MEPKVNEQLTELTEQELVETEGGFGGFNFGIFASIIVAKGIGDPGKTPGGGLPRL